MNWHAFEEGSYGLDNPGGRPDPYFIWAVATKHANFPSYREPTGTKTIQVIIEMVKGKFVGDLRAAVRQARSEATASDPTASDPPTDEPAAENAASDITISEFYPDTSRYCTADVSLDFFMWVAGQSNKPDSLVLRTEMCVPLAPAQSWHDRTLTLHPVDMPRSETPVLLGVIDDGCAFAHASLARDNGSCRILAIWDQEPDPRLAIRVPDQPDDEMMQGVSLGVAVGKVQEVLRSNPSIPIGDNIAATDTVLDVKFLPWEDVNDLTKFPPFFSIERHSVSWRPQKLLRGVQVTRKQIKALLDACKVRHDVDEEACYRAMRYAPPQGRLTHGMHVLNLMASRCSLADRLGVGPDGTRTPCLTKTQDEASRSDVVFVQMPRAELRDPSGLWLGASVLDGIRYVYECANKQETKRIVVNVSYGPQHGPHDGTSILECAMADLVAQARRDDQRELAIVLPAGNGFMSRGHAALTIEANEKEAAPLHWRILPDTDTPSFLEIWLPSGTADVVQVEVIPPGVRNGRGSPITAGRARLWPSTDRPQCGVVFARQVSRGLNGTMILVAVSPSVARHAGDAVAPHGIWTVHLGRYQDAPQDSEVKADAYVVRNDVNLGGRRPRRQSYLVDDQYDAERWWRAAPDDVQQSDVQVRRRGSLSGIACGNPGSGVYVVGGYRRSDGQACPDSASGPARGGQRVGPDCSAIMDQSIVLRGVPAAGTRSGSIVRLRGTSMAAPQFARALANAPFPSQDAVASSSDQQRPVGNRQAIGRPSSTTSSVAPSASEVVKASSEQVTEPDKQERLGTYKLSR